MTKHCQLCYTRPAVREDRLSWVSSEFRSQIEASLDFSSQFRQVRLADASTTGLASNRPADDQILFGQMPIADRG